MPAEVDGDAGVLGIVGMIDVAASICRQDHFLTPRGEAVQVPAYAGEGALGVLAVDAQDGEAVGLQLDISAGDIAEAEAGVDCRERDRSLSLAVIDAQALESPAGDRD